MSEQDAIARLEAALDRLEAAAQSGAQALAALRRREAALAAAAERTLDDLDQLLARAAA
jgi:prefoldin subunit 5